MGKSWSYTNDSGNEEKRKNVSRERTIMTEDNDRKWKKLQLEQKRSIRTHSQDRIEKILSLMEYVLRTRCQHVWDEWLLTRW
jgi:hypothetical protein